MRPRMFLISSPCDSRRFLSQLWLAVALGGGVTTDQ